MTNQVVYQSASKVDRSAQQLVCYEALRMLRCSRQIRSRLKFASLMEQDSAQPTHVSSLEPSTMTALIGTQGDGKAAVADPNRAPASADPSLIVQQNA